MARKVLMKVPLPPTSRKAKLHARQLTARVTIESTAVVTIRALSPNSPLCCRISGAVSINWMASISR